MPDVRKAFDDANYKYIKLRHVSHMEHYVLMGQ